MHQDDQNSGEEDAARMPRFSQTADSTCQDCIFPYMLTDPPFTLSIHNIALSFHPHPINRRYVICDNINSGNDIGATHLSSIDSSDHLVDDGLGRIGPSRRFVCHIYLICHVHDFSDILLLCALLH